MLKKYFICAILTMAFALLLSLAAIAKEVRIDKRNASSEHRHVLVFCGLEPTDSFVGHAFVVWGKEDSSKQVSWSQAFGFYPETAKAGAKSMFGPVPGEIRDDGVNCPDGSNVRRLFVDVSPDAFDKSLGILEAWKSKTGSDSYQLVLSDCTTFALEVGKSIDLKIPDRSWAESAFPFAAIDKLIELNPGSEGTSLP